MMKEYVKKSIVMATALPLLWGCASYIKPVMVSEIPNRQYENVTVIELPSDQALAKNRKYDGLVFGGKTKLISPYKKDMGPGTPEEYKNDIRGMIFHELRDKEGKIVGYTASPPGASTNTWQEGKVITVTIDPIEILGRSDRSGLFPTGDDSGGQ